MTLLSVSVTSKEPEEKSVARQRLDKHICVATNAHETTEELLDAAFSMRFVSRPVCTERCLISPKASFRTITNYHVVPTIYGCCCHHNKILTGTLRKIYNNFSRMPNFHQHL
jgi:hypothetical protein